MLQKSTEFNINLNAEDNFKQTPFHLACKNNQLEVVKFLIQNSAEWNIDLSAVDNDGYTAFNKVCKEGPESIKELIIQNSDDFNIDLSCSAERWEKLMHALLIFEILTTFATYPKKNDVLRSEKTD